MAGTATRAPTGTVARPASTRASNHGTPALPARWAKVVAPTAAKVAWHSETCPDVTTRRRSDANTSTYTRAVEYTGRRGPAKEGTATSTAIRATAPAIRTPGEMRGRLAADRMATLPSSTRRPRRAKTRTAN